MIPPKSWHQKNAREGFFLLDIDPTLKTMTGASLLESMSLCILRECILPISLIKCQKLIIEIEFYISAFATGCIRKEAFYGKWT